MKLTKTIIDNLPFPISGQQFFWDDDLTGFALRLTPTKKTYIAQARVRGAGKSIERRVSLGEHGIITLQEARRKAQKSLSAMNEGKDPVIEKQTAIAYAKTLREFAEDYIENKKDKLKQSSKADILKHVNKSFSDWADRPAVNITRDTVSKRFKELSAKSHAQANQAFRILRAVMNFARGKSYQDGKSILAENPVKILSDLDSWNNIEPRKVKIPTDKIGAAWNVLQSLREAPEQSLVSRTLADAVSFLLLTGARWSEMANLTWDDLNIDESWWRLNDPKNRNPVTFPLSHVAYEILKSRPKSEKYVFPSRINDGHIKDARSVMDKISEAAGVRIAPHDLRRTFRTIAGECKIELYKIKLLMNHKMSGDVTIKHYTETNDLTDLSNEINLIASWIIRQGKIAAAGNVLSFPVQQGGKKR
jgi:integrase